MRTAVPEEQKERIVELALTTYYSYSEIAIQVNRCKTTICSVLQEYHVIRPFPPSKGGKKNINGANRTKSPTTTQKNRKAHFRTAKKVGPYDREETSSDDEDIVPNEDPSKKILMDVAMRMQHEGRHKRRRTQTRTPLATRNAIHAGDHDLDVDDGGSSPKQLRDEMDEAEDFYRLDRGQKHFLDGIDDGPDFDNEIRRDFNEPMIDEMAEGPEFDYAPIRNNTEETIDPKLYLPMDGSKDYKKWTVQQVYEWCVQFLSRSIASDLRTLLVNGEWLENLLQERIPMGAFTSVFKKSLNAIEEHLRLVIEEWIRQQPEKEHLLLKKDEMNAICNNIYSCKDLRNLVSDEGLKERPRFNGRTHMELAGVFLSKTKSAERLRLTLPKKFHEGPQDIHALFDELINILAPQLPLDSLRCDYVGFYKCENCQRSEYGPDVHEYFFRTLKIQDGSFISSLTARNLMKKSCESCGRKDVWKFRKTFCPEKYHFVLVNYAKDDLDRILDLTFNSEVEMYGAKWKIISVTERMMIDDQNTAPDTTFTGTEFESMETEVASNHMDTSVIVLDDTVIDIPSAGDLLPTPIKKSSRNPFVSWVRTGDQWTCIHDDKVIHRAVLFSDLDIKILVFEKI